MIVPYDRPVMFKTVCEVFLFNNLSVLGIDDKNRIFTAVDAKTFYFMFVFES